MRSTIFLFPLVAALIHSDLVNAAASPGCGTAVASGLTRGGTAFTNTLSFTTSSGIVRQYALHIPTSYDIYTPAPLAFSFHGRGETAATHEVNCQMSNETWNPNFLVVYPTGINHQWQGDPAATSDDVGFTLQLLANLSSTYCIDSSRVFAAGKSNGGGFSANVLACDPVASRTIAAFAGMSGAFYQGNTDINCSGDSVAISCNPGRAPVPVLETHGSADRTIPYVGGPRRGSCLPSIPRFMTDKGQRAGVGRTNASTSLYNGNVLKYAYGDNATLYGVVTHYWVNGMGHIWPAVSAGTYFDATPIMFNFFNTWTLDTTPITILNTTTTTTSSTTTSITSTTSSIPSFTFAGSNVPTSSKTSSTASVVPTASALSCPASDGQIYTASNGATFLLECGIDHSGGDLQLVYMRSYEDCINSCSTTSGCVDVSLSGTACYQKKTLGASVKSSGILGAKLVANAASSSSPTLLTASLTTSPTISQPTLQSTSVITSSAGSSSASSKSTSTSSLSQTFSTITSTGSSTFSSTSSLATSNSVGPDGYTTTTFPPTCTAINTNVYAVADGTGLSYLYMCGGGSTGSTAQTITNVANWTECYSACDNYTGCTGFTYNLGANFGAGVGQCLIKTGVQSFASTASLLSTRIAGLRVTSLTSSTSPFLTSSTSPSLTTSISSSLSTTFSSSALTTSSYSTTLSSPTSTAISSSASTHISTSASPSISTSQTATTSSITSSSTAISSSSSSPSTSSAPARSTPSSSAPSCPAANGTVLIEPNGFNYTIVCSRDSSSSISGPSYPGSFAGCVSLCDITTNCTSVSWTGSSSACYLLASLGGYVINAVRQN